MDVQSNYSGKNRVSDRSGASIFLFARLGRGDAHPANTDVHSQQPHWTIFLISVYAYGSLGIRILSKRCAYSTDTKNLGLETKAGRMSFSLPFKYISAEVGHHCLNGGV